MAAPPPNGVHYAGSQITLEELDRDCVLIAGGGPVGLVLSTTLASYGVKSVVLERNQTTTRWPKMDLTNARSMEMFRRLGLAEDLRKQGVPSQFPYTVRFSEGLNESRCIAQWDLPSVDKYKEAILNQNDGTMPLEPYQRLSQTVFEAWLKLHCDENPLIDLRFGCKLESIEETEVETRVIVTDVATGQQKTITTKFLAGCDGASSRTRRNLGIPLEGGPVPGYSLLIHFRSQDLSRLHQQGQFWHIFFLDKGALRGAIIAQDEKDTWTTHLMLPLDVDSSQIDSYDAIYTVLGGTNNNYKIKVDEILVRSTYRPSIAIATKYSSPSGRTHLAGDAAHQNIPTGGYGMNLGLTDAFDLGWKLAAVINGKGGMGLLSAYERDRRPVALQSIERSGVHNSVHYTAAAILNGDNSAPGTDFTGVVDPTELIRAQYKVHDGENKDLGIEMGYRYKSPICILDTQSAEPLWVPSRYVPSTWPGSRAPHVFLRDGTPIFDLYDKYFTLVDFSDTPENGAKYLLDAARKYDTSVKHIRLPDEPHAAKVWEKPLVLLRPDGHVSWRGEMVESGAEAEDIITKISGLHVATQDHVPKEEPESVKVFTSVVGSEKQTTEYKLTHMGDFQK